ncbi:hypothetical protein OJ364_003610 [Salmonella enterica]|nr:hypothetical protein [Salmonella enterica]ECS6950463.1 hypothetical protein [Salmonella enterica subsp. enterica serovar Litchfield]EFV3005403.1 hypothetical protein [Salmonella enterica subsp. enterica serovar 4,[5],12:i:-]EAS4272088.1 hypothetical protein [Salmonella enterica]EAS7098862.1 hypothetical protein [Salmonella enterica]
MKNNMTFVLIGFDNLTNKWHCPLYDVMRDRGFNIVRHDPYSMIGDVRFLSMHNNRPTVVIGVMSDEDREMYRGIPAIHFRDDLGATVKAGDYELVSGMTVAKFDEIIYGLTDEEPEETDYEDEEEDDDDYAPVVFSSNGCGYFGYNEAFDML